MPDLSAGSCRGLDPELFFPERGGNDTAQQALAVCHTCPCRDACLGWAIANEAYGIWGGTTESERQRIRKQRGADRCADRPPPPHGTLARYRKECRCGLCVEARRERSRYDNARRSP